ncbi:MAG: hypothetical protein JO252_14555 [Planctomycetaceae bacterium]|nr:hypothetical protein [Planctomycetaceae bacterium]
MAGFAFGQDSEVANSVGISATLNQLPQLGQDRTDYRALIRLDSLFAGPTSAQTPMECQPRVVPLLRRRSRGSSEDAMDLRHSTVTKDGETHTSGR